MDTAATNKSVRRFKAKYAPTRDATMEKNVVLNSGESVWFRASVFQRKRWWQRVSGVIWLTQERLLLLECYGFVRDSILEIPRACVKRLECQPGSERRRVKVTYSDSSREASWTCKRLSLRCAMTAASLPTHWNISQTETSNYRAGGLLKPGFGLSGNS